MTRTAATRAAAAAVSAATPTVPPPETTIRSRVSASAAAAAVAVHPPAAAPTAVAEGRATPADAKSWPELSKGQVVMYEHRKRGWILAEIVGVDHEGAFDGGATYVISAPELDGVIETERSRLHTQMPPTY